MNYCCRNIKVLIESLFYISKVTSKTGFKEIYKNVRKQRIVKYIIK